MTLPEIILPKIVLPFEVPVLWHPAVDHFLIAIPVVVVLLELMNLIMKKKAVGGVTFFLLVLTVLFAVTAYFTGLADGKEAYPALSEAAKTALGEHKLLGTYLMLGSAVLLLLKLLAMTGNKVLRGIFIFVLIAFTAVMLKQGKEGGELVYVHGINVEAVATLESDIFDLNESLEESEEALAKALKKVETAASSEQNETCSVPVAKESKEESEVSHVPSVATPVFAPVLDEANTSIEEKEIHTPVPEETLKEMVPPAVEEKQELNATIPLVTQDASTVNAVTTGL